MALSGKEIEVEEGILSLRLFGPQFTEEIPAVDSICELHHEIATLETIVGEPAKKERLESEGVTQKSAVLVAQLLWAAHAWNTTSEQASQKVVADLYAHLSHGSSVSVHVEELDGTEHRLEVTAERAVNRKTAPIWQRRGSSVSSGPVTKFAWHVVPSTT